LLCATIYFHIKANRLTANVAGTLVKSSENSMYENEGARKLEARGWRTKTGSLGSDPDAAVYSFFVNLKNRWGPLSCMPLAGRDVTFVSKGYASESTLRL